MCPGDPGSHAVDRRALVLALLLVPGGASAQEPTNRDQSGYTELNEEGYPLKESLEIVRAEDSGLKDDELVLGVEIGDEARAYPVNLMWKPGNEVLNDAIGGNAIAATWCPIAHSPVVYDRRLGDREVDLGAVGLERGVFILYDRETGSWWNQIAGRAVRGPLEGRTLRRLPSTLTTWGRWRSLHPRTTAYTDPDLPGRRRFTEESFARITLAGDGPVVNEDLVVAVEGKEGARAWVLRRLALERVANDVVGARPVVVFLGEDAVTARVLDRSVGGRTLTFRAEGERLRDVETGTLWDPMTGQALEGPLEGQALAPVSFTQALWYAWRSQRPDTTLGGE